MADVVVVYHSGYGHTRKQAEAVAQGAEAALIAISAEGDITGADWAALEAAAEATGTVHIGVDHPVSQGLVLALTSNARPTFVWEHEP